MIEILAWCPDRDTFVSVMTTTFLPVQTGIDDEDKPVFEKGPPLCTVDSEGRLNSIPGLAIDEIGTFARIPAVLDEEMNVVTPAVMSEGHHVNLLVYRELADMLTAGKPQVGEADEETGELKQLGLFERTNLLSLFPSLVWDDSQKPAGGYVSPDGLKLFDPATIKYRKRVWF